MKFPELTDAELADLIGRSPEVCGYYFGITGEPVYCDELRRSCPLHGDEDDRRRT